MGVDVQVRRCSLTIRRRDGWSWGPDPRPHLDAALAAVEAALESAVEEAGLEPGLDGSLDGPVRLEIAADGTVTTASRTALVEQLQALRRPPGGEIAGPDPVDAPAPADVPAREAPGAVAAGPVAGPALARTLARWSRAGQMARIARAWPEPVLRAWIDAVAAGTGEASAVAPMSAEAIAAIAEAVLGDATPGLPARAAAERLLVLLAALTAALGDRLPDAATHALAASAAQGAAVQGSAGAAAAAPAAGTAGSEPRPDGPRSRTPPSPRPSTEIVPALPFLVLAELSRIGYADAIQAAAEAAAQPDAAAGLAAALAGKVLPPPGRGWERAPAERAAIALAAGRGPAWVDEGLAAMARGAGALLAPLAAALQAAYAEGRSAGDEVLVTATGDGIVAGEEEGLLPIAWVATEDELDTVLEGLGRPPARRAAAFAILAATLGERAALPRLAAPALERHLGAAAGTALGLLALDLWGAETATPLLALERLGDLEARVEATADGLVVAVPRGRRWLDLQRAGLLEWFAVPWLPGGRLEVGTW